MESVADPRSLPRRALRLTPRVPARREILDGEHRWLIEETEPGRVRFTQSERFGGILAPLLWKKLRDGGTAKGFRAMNEALAARVAELRQKST